ncbi:three component ABC system middle component [Paenibacillus sp. 8b26]|uniref:three component ABC system middle component n=1 Tax=Paenibacillus sp. 8b26 TaxID=3424133 RepID=UPI003D657378
MDDLDEYEVVQNIALGSLALWSFSVEYYKTVEEKKGIDLRTLMLVLPLVYNESIANAVYKRKFKGGLFNSLNDDKALFIGLQERMQDMSVLSLKSLNLCLSSNLLLYQNSSYEFLPIRMGNSNYDYAESIKKILAASKRFGYWFSTIEFNELCQLLKVRF